MLQLLVLKLRHPAALCTDLMMMGVAVITFFVLGGISELMFDDQTGIDEKYDGIVKGSAAHTEIFLIRHQRIECIYIEMSFNGVDGIKYGITFGSLTMPVRIEIFGEYLLYRIFYVLTFHFCRRSFTANKVKPFLWKANENKEKIKIMHQMRARQE